MEQAAQADEQAGLEKVEAMGGEMTEAAMEGLEVKAVKAVWEEAMALVVRAVAVVEALERAAAVAMVLVMVVEAREVEARATAAWEEVGMVAGRMAQVVMVVANRVEATMVAAERVEAVMVAGGVVAARAVVRAEAVRAATTEVVALVVG